MLKKEANKIVGGLSKTAKMPGLSYGLPAAECKTGSKLRQIKGSVCEKCYAMKGCYAWPVVKNAQYNRLDQVKNNSKWVEAMITLIKGQAFFRWHDSGDLVDSLHLSRIVEIVKATPDTKHWLPTKEYKLIKGYLMINGEFPENLVVRVSSPHIDQKPLKFKGLHTSTVVKNGSPDGHVCPSSQQNGECKDCRACWDKEVSNVTYKLH